MADEPQDNPNDTGDDQTTPQPDDTAASEPAAEPADDVTEPAAEPAADVTDAAGDAEAALDAADQAAADIGSEVEQDQAPAGDSGPPEGKPFEVPEFDATTPTANKTAGVDLLGDVNLKVKIELGRTQMFVDDVLQLGEGAVVELDKLAGDPVDVFVNDRHIARGEVLVLNDNFCVRVNEIIDPIEDKPSRT